MFTITRPTKIAVAAVLATAAIGASGVQTQTFTGFNAAEGVNLTVGFAAAD